ncbi:MAG: hypothetical protein ACI85O_002977 [Saprospiraceae bacterium]|jgi:hypothetical protein
MCLFIRTSKIGSLFITNSLTTFFATAQDVAICGWDGNGGDEITFVLLRDFAAGEVIYFTEDEYSKTSHTFLFGEGHVAYTVPAGGLLENEVIRITETATANVFTLGCAAGTVAAVGVGSWSFSNVDEIYTYSASNTSTPWSSVTEVHCFAWGSNTSTLTDQEPASDYPNVIRIAFNIGDGSGVNANFNDASRVNTTKAMLQNGANWTRNAGVITLSCTNFTSQMIALLVELINLEANKKDENVLLNWSTATEINNDYFLIEHDGKNFERIEQVAGVGNSDLINHYNFTHKNPANGFNYYRLQQVDYDGQFAYSDIVSVKVRDENQEVSVYPNPFTESITVDISLLENSSSSNSERTIKVFDIHNRLVQSNKFSNNEETIRLNLAQLSGGIFFICTYMENGNFITRRVLKQL